MNGGITPSGYHSNFNTEADTISISEGGNSCGYVQYNNSKFWSGGHCYALTKPNSTILNKYLYYFLKFNEQHITSLRVGSGLPNIQKKDLEKFEIRYPNYEDQLEIVRVLDLLTDKLEVEKSFLVLLTKQKQYLLKNLFI
jgi:type I restriction enzyme S subunit